MPLQGFAFEAVPRPPHLADAPLLDALRLALPDRALDEAIAASQSQEQRRRLLPARLVVALVIAMGLWARDGLRDVLANLVAGLREQDPAAWADWHLPAKSALTQARQRLGPRPLILLFRRLAGPAATPAMPGAFLFGLRLMAIDGTTLDLPDTPDNARCFGRPSTSRGLGVGAFPQLRILWLVEAGTHLLCDVVLRPYFRGEAPAARQLLRSVGAGMLVMWDRGLHSYAMIRDTRARGAACLGRVGKAVVLDPEQILADGTFLARVYPSPKARRHQQDGILVRVIEYTIDDPARPGHGQRHRLLTSLLEPAIYPAEDLAAAYHERWEIESTADEVKTHQADRRPAPPVRSRRPREVVQEVYGLLLAHLAVRLTMAEAAAVAGVDPDELSFTGTLRILRRAVSQFQRSQLDPAQLPFGWAGC
jgi:Insertion element 4 transposase N-terminal/Transposase DDE domain